MRAGVLFFAAVLSAFFSGAETALFSLRPEDLSGGKSATAPSSRLMLKLLEHPSRLLTTIVFSNMAANLLFFSVSYFLIVTSTRPLPAYAPPLLAAGSLLFVIFFCEIVPKNLAVAFSRPFGSVASYPIYAIQTLLWPVLAPIERLTSALSTLLTRAMPEQPPPEADELQMLVEFSEKEGLVEEDVGEMIAKVLELSDIAVREILVPRVDLVCFHVETAPETVEKLFRESKHTLLPVYEGGMDNMAGVVHVRDFFFSNKNSPIRELIRPVPFIPESASAEDALHRMRTEQCRMVFVVDEYGALEGLITIEDIIEEIVGEIGDEYDVAAPVPVEKLADTRYRLRGDLGIREWKKIFSPGTESDIPADTVGGLIMTLLGRIPATGDTVTYENLSFRVESIQGRRIKYVILELPAERNAGCT